jgi:hypothetical protein
MRPVTVSQTGTGRSSVIVTDYINTPFNGRLFTTVSGAVVYNVQETPDDIFSPTFISASAAWYTLSGSFSGATTSGVLAIDSPNRGLSINVTSGAGNVTLTYIQGLQN